MIPFSALSFWEKQWLFEGLHTLVIGSGLVGLSTAIHLKQKYPKRKICILERSYLPAGASTKNAGFACIGSPSELLDDLKNESVKQVFNRVDKRWRGLQYLREMLGDAALDFQELGSHELFAQKDQNEFAKCLNHLDFLNRELASITGIQHCFELAGQVILDSGFHGFKQAIAHRAEGQIDTGKMMQNLVSKANEMGIHILNGIEVLEIESKRVICKQGNIAFEQLALCNNALAKEFYPELDVSPARAQVIISKPISNLRMKGVFHADRGYYYFRNVGQRVLLGGGRNLDFASESTSSMETTESIITHLKDIMSRQILPNQEFEIEDSWAGSLGIGKSKQEIIAQVRENQFVAVRLGGMGVAIGSILGKELADRMS